MRQHHHHTRNHPRAPSILPVRPLYKVPLHFQEKTNKQEMKTSFFVKLLVKLFPPLVKGACFSLTVVKKKA
jgi:hypothetical protein